MRRGFARERVDDGKRLLDGPPILAAPRAMAINACAHLLVACRAGCEIHALEAAVSDEAFGESRFAGSRAPEDERGHGHAHGGGRPSSGDHPAAGMRATSPRCNASG